MFIPARPPEVSDYSLAGQALATGKIPLSDIPVGSILEKLRNGPDTPQNEDDILLPAHFSFRWAGLKFAAILENGPKGDHVVTLMAVLGRLPYSAEDHEARRTVLAELNTSYKILDGVYEVTSSGEVLFQAATSFSGELTPETLLHAITISLLQLKRHLKAFCGRLLPA